MRIIGLDLGQFSPAAIAATKALIREAGDEGLSRQMDRERDLQGIAGRSTQMRAAVQAFMRRRK